MMYVTYHWNDVTYDWTGAWPGFSGRGFRFEVHGMSLGEGLGPRLNENNICAKCALRQ